MPTPCLPSSPCSVRSPCRVLPAQRPGLKAGRRQLPCQAAKGKGGAKQQQLQKQKPPDTALGTPAQQHRDPEMTQQKGDVAEETGAAAQEAAAEQQDIVDPDNVSTELKQRIAAAQKRKQQQQQEKTGFAEGILQETKLIEWPTLRAAAVNTLLVVAIVGGASIVLFGVNSLLATAADQIYSGALSAEKLGIREPVRRTIAPQRLKSAPAVEAESTAKRDNAEATAPAPKAGKGAQQAKTPSIEQLNSFPSEL